MENKDKLCNTLIILSKDKNRMSIVNCTQDNERSTLVRVMVAMSAMLLGYIVSMKDLQKMLTLLASKDGNDFIFKALQQSLLEENDIEMLFENDEDREFFQDILHNEIFETMAEELSVLDCVYADYHAVNSQNIAKSTGNFQKRHLEEGIGWFQFYFESFNKNSLVLMHDNSEEYQDYDIMCIDFWNEHEKTDYSKTNQ